MESHKPEIKLKVLQIRLIIYFVLLAIFHSPAFAQYKKLLDFDGKNGWYPNGDLFFDGTFLYGMVSNGGTNGKGNLFKLKPDGTGYVKLLDFNGVTNGAFPNGSLISDGTFLYRMTALGGKNGYTSISGTIFKYCLRPTKSTDTISACDSYAWNGNTYTVSGIYTDTIPNAEGCDSIMTLHLTIKNATIGSIYITSCKSVVSPSGKYTYNSIGYYSDTIPNIKGCDSILTIYFIRTSLHDTVFVNSCDTLVSPSGKYVYRSTGIYSDTLLSHQNCDSIITTNLTIKPIQLSLSKSNNISCDTPYTTIIATGADFYKWEPADGLSDVNAANPIVTTVVSRTYYLTATNSLGCSIRDSIKVFVEKKDSAGLIPNVFTPNDDGFNDCFNVSSLTKFKAIELNIINRWGQIVFRTTDTNACWNGKTSTGTDLSDGVYFYILSGTGKCGEEINLQGTITLLR